MEITEKSCSRCKAVKPASAFALRDKKGNYRSQCRACVSAGVQACMRAKPEAERKEKERVRNAERKEYMKQYIAANRKEISQAATDKARAKRAAIAPRCKVFFLVCAQTGVLFTAKNKTALYSPEAIRIKGLERIREKAKAAKEAANLLYTCKHCDNTFTPEYGNQQRIYCSKECLTRSMKIAHPSNHRKRARAYGSPYEPVNVLAVFARDGWKCQLCGIDTPKRLKGTYDANAPELDHVVPISKGGAHSYENTQCACRRCNGLKSDTMPHLWSLKGVRASFLQK